MSQRGHERIDARNRIRGSGFVTIEFSISLTNFGMIAGPAVQSVASYIAAPHRPRLILDRAAAKPLFDIGRWVFVTEVVEVAAAAALSAIITRSLGAEQLGLYFLATRLAQLPTRAARQLVSAVAFAVHAAVQGETRRAGKAFRSSLSAMLLLLVPVFAVAIALAPALVEHLIGDNWAGSTPVIRLLAIAGIVGVISERTVPMLRGRGHTAGIARLYGVRSLLMIALAWWLTGLYNVSGAALAWLAGETAGMVYAISFARRLIPHPFRGPRGRVAAIGVSGVTGAGIALATSRLLISGTAGVVLASALGLVLAVALLWRLDRAFGLSLADELLEVFPGLRPRRRT